LKKYEKEEISDETNIKVIEKKKKAETEEIPEETNI